MRTISLLDLGVDFKILKKRIMSRVKKVNGCWIWQGHCHARKVRKLSYGRVSVRGVNMYAHVVMYELHKKRRASRNFVLRHTCNNPPCCNPRHLQPGTQRRNVRDALEQGTHWSPRGETHHSARLNREKARLIRQRSKTTSVRELAEELGVHQSSIRKVLRGETWK